MNPKDGYAVKDCIDERHRRLLQFLVPILHPKKPSRLTITLENQIFGTIVANQKLDWGRIMFDLVSGLITRIRGSRATPLCPFLYHLYQYHNLFFGTEEKTWRHQKVLLKYGESETDDKPDDSIGSEPGNERRRRREVETAGQAA